MAKLTTDILKNAFPESGDRLEIRDDEEPGLIFRVTRTGKRTWSVRYRNVAGEHRRKSLGSFPAVSLSRAREEARKVKGSVASGADLVASERDHRRKELDKRLHTMAGLAELYFEDSGLGLHKANARGPKRSGTIELEKLIFNKHIKPKFGKRAVSDLSRIEIQAFVSSVSRKTPSAGRLCRNVIRQIMSYAVSREIIQHNPALQVAVVAAKARERVLSDDELRRLWHALGSPSEVPKLSLSKEMGLAIQLAAATLQRGGEVIGMAWSEVNLENRIWTIPADRMKNHKVHLVPLSETAISLINQARVLIDGETFVFESTRGSGTHMERRALSRAMSRTTMALGIENATAHDLRRTGATLLTSERIGIPRFVVSQVLGHSSDTGGAAAITGIHYDRYDYLAEKRRALDSWSELLREITGQIERAPNVVPMTKKAGA